MPITTKDPPNLPHAPLLYFLPILLLLLLVPPCSTKLLHVSTIFRHGARYPIALDYDIWDSRDMVNQSGLLTEVGMRQLFQFGTQFRDGYVEADEDGDYWDVLKDAELYSSPYPRCVQSALAFILGLTSDKLTDKQCQTSKCNRISPIFQTNSQYLQQNSYTFTQDPSTNTYTVTIAPQSESKSLSFKIRPDLLLCSQQLPLLLKRIGQLKNQLLQFEQNNKNLIARLQDIFELKQKYVNLMSMRLVYDIVITDKFLGRRLPDGFTREDFRRLRYVQGYLFAVLYSGDFGRAYMAEIMPSVLGNMEKSIHKSAMHCWHTWIHKQTKKYTFYSGHDSTIVALLTGLNFTSAECLTKKWNNQTNHEGNCAHVIPFASNLIFQLHQHQQEEKNGYFVKVKYNGEYMFLCEKESFQCEYQEFIGRVKDYYRGFEKDCYLEKDMLIEETTRYKAKVYSKII